MKMTAFVVYDSVVKAYRPPFFMVSVPAAQRAFADVANNKENDIGRNPQDYTLYSSGVFDDETGVFTPEEPKSNLGLAASYVKG